MAAAAVVVGVVVEEAVDNGFDVESPSVCSFRAGWSRIEGFLAIAAVAASTGRVAAMVISFHRINWKQASSTDCSNRDRSSFSSSDTTQEWLATTSVG